MRPLVRRLVVVWIAHNMVFVASSLLRTADYIEAYALTRFRIAAMIWMALVAGGLVLICWCMLAGKSAHWLINANAMAALIVLAVVSVVDLGAVVAGWNVRHAREVRGRGVELDLGYLHTLGAPALVSLVELETTTDDVALRDRVFTTRRGEGGAGLGLSIARALLAANDATLDLIPTTEGAVFELVMPFAE